VCQLTVSPSVTATLVVARAPPEPPYVVPPMVTRSQQLSVSKAVARTRPAPETLAAQSSLAP
jgi:hypothetical protein